MHARAAELVGTLALAPHPEGGWYREVFRSPHRVVPDDGRASRSALTSIYFLLTSEIESAWHRVDSDETWHLYEGGPLDLHVFDPATRDRRVHRLSAAGAVNAPVHAVPAGCWQSARSIGEYTLVGCTVGPGFEFEDFRVIAEDPDTVDVAVPPVPAAAAGNAAPRVRHYDANYDRFSSDLYTRIRREAFGEDIGQNSWLTVDEHDRFIEWLELAAASRLADIACGSGLTTLRIADRTGCTVVGIDMHTNAVAEGRQAAGRMDLANRATFELADASRPLPFPSGSFDALVCIDAINHLPDRRAVLAEWARVLKPGGRLVFTDPIVITGPLTAAEIAIRSSIGFFLFVPPGTDERMVHEAGFDVTDVVDRTENMARIARRRGDVRQRYAQELRQVEGAETFDGQQRFLEVAARLAEERRLSRQAFRAVRRS